MSDIEAEFDKCPEEYASINADNIRITRIPQRTLIGTAISAKILPLARAARRGIGGSPQIQSQQYCGAAQTNISTQLRYTGFEYFLAVTLWSLKRRSMAPLREWRAARTIAWPTCLIGSGHSKNNSDVAARKINRPGTTLSAKQQRLQSNPSHSFGTRTCSFLYPDVSELA